MAPEDQDEEDQGSESQEDDAGDDDGNEYPDKDRLTESAKRSGRRGRPPGSKNKATIARELATRTVRPAVKPRRKQEEESAYEAYDDETASPSATPSRRGGPGRRPGFRPGKRGRSVNIQSMVLDDSGNPLNVDNDEYVLEIDEEGEKKLKPNGELLGGRHYRVRTFTVVGKGDRLYMLSTEPARCMGFRDSYLLFQKHRKLYKVIADDMVKYDLIERGLMPHSYKGRSIALVTARSVYREFGAKIIIGGKSIIDDYYETEARNAGLISGEIADPDDKLPAPGEPYNKNQYVAWHGASYSVYHPIAAMPTTTREIYRETSFITHKRRKVAVTDENWMFEHAAAVSHYNSAIVRRRYKTMTPGGVYEPHVGICFYPQHTQPTKVSWSTEGEHPISKVIIETRMIMPNAFKRTGLKDVDPSVFEDVDPEIKMAILEQQGNERQWDSLGT
jgi:chromatin structure-remodeling complex protein RSC7